MLKVADDLIIKKKKEKMKCLLQRIEKIQINKIKKKYIYIRIY